MIVWTSRPLEILKSTLVPALTLRRLWEETPPGHRSPAVVTGQHGRLGRLHGAQPPRFGDPRFQLGARPGPIGLDRRNRRALRENLDHALHTRVNKTVEREAAGFCELHDKRLGRSRRRGETTVDLGGAVVDVPARRRSDDRVDDEVRLSVEPECGTRRVQLPGDRVARGRDDQRGRRLSAPQERDRVEAVDRKAHGITDMDPCRTRKEAVEVEMWHFDRLRRPRCHGRHEGHRRRCREATHKGE